MDKKKYFIPLLLIIPFVLFPLGSRDIITRANEAYMTGDYNQALSLYEEAEVENPESPHIYFNKGISYYRLEDYEKAKQAFLSAASRSQDLKLEAKAYYNLGNTNFFEAARHVETDLKKAIELYQEAIVNYQVAMERDENILDAAHNIEVTRLIVQDLLDKLKKQQEQNAEQQEKLKEIIEKLLKLIEQEQREIDFTQSLKEEKDTKGISGNLRNNVTKVKKEQQNIRKETIQVSRELAELIPQGISAQDAQAQGASRILTAKEHVDLSAGFQHLTENQLAEIALEKALESEGKAQEELIKALEALVNPQSGQDQEQEEDEEEKQKEEEMDQQAADADDILDEEREQRRARQRQDRSGYREVERDW